MALKQIEERGGGFGHICPFLLPPNRETGEGVRGGGGPGRRPWGLGGDRVGGEKGQGGAGN